MSGSESTNIQHQQAVPSTVKSSSYQNVVHNKEVGTIILTDTNLTFYPLSGVAPQQLLWACTIKHQVSPVTHPRHLLKILLSQKNLSLTGKEEETKDDGNKNTSSHTYEFQSRDDLERIRQDISNRLVNSRRIQALNADQPSIQRKRKLSDLTPGTHPEPPVSQESSALTSLSNYEHSVSCSSILASDRNMRTQHTFLTATKPTNGSDLQTIPKNEPEPIVEESDFWSTHNRKVSNQYAKIQGYIKKGMSSSIKSSLDIQISGNIVSKPVRLGVDEIRQIFIMYPAVHAAYEEKVPLELSEEQFWRKYLESEYFHRDRGRLGAFTKTLDKKDDEITSSHPVGSTNGPDAIEIDKKGISKDDENKAVAKEREENARMGAASSSDIFARKEVELQRLQAQSLSSHRKKHSSMYIAIGQFDLTSTANTERGSKLLLKSSDLEPSDDRARKVIEKYNKHWAIVLNSSLACAGCDVSDLVRESVNHVMEGDVDAMPNGGLGKEMQQLVKIASTADYEIGHVDGLNEDADESELVLYRELKLSNVNVYNRGEQNAGSVSDIADRNLVFSRSCLDQLKSFVQQEISLSSPPDHHTSETAFPEAGFGRNLLLALTKHMVRDAMTDTDTAKQVKMLPEEFRMQLTSYTRRSYELLRHFFALRHVIDVEMKQNNSTSTSSQKLDRILKAMEKLFRELENKRNELPHDRGEQMRVMLLQTMEQLDWAIKLNPRTSRRTGGFVTVAD